ncbi:MAG: lysophospholipid acyltransferase family protein [Spirochaetota bacterium]
MRSILKLAKLPVDFLFTLLFWLYIIFGFLFFYIPVLIILSFVLDNREAKFQRLNHYYYRGFFLGMNTLVPGLSIEISTKIKKLKSSIIILNHRSYLDPILLVSIFPKHKTIVKGIFFKVPFISWAMKSGGYIPFNADLTYNDSMNAGMKDIPDFIKDGGNLFIFPEGSRSRDGNIKKFHKGAFSIACKYKIPVQVLYIKNTDRLFPPGKPFLNTCISNAISIEMLGTLNPSNTSPIEMRKKAVTLYQEKIKKEKPN